MKRLIIVTLILLSTNALVFAVAPTIDTVGIVGSTITVDGGGFELTEPPLRYDNFESGTVGEQLDIATWNWQSYGTSGRYPAYSTTHIRKVGTKSVLQDFTTGNFSQYIGLKDIDDVLGISTQSLYFSGYWYAERNATWADGVPSALSPNTKMLNAGTANGSSWQTRVDIYPNTNGGEMYANLNSTCAGGTATSPCKNTSNEDISCYGIDPDTIVGKNDGLWHRLEGWIDIGDAGTAGYRNLSVDGVMLKEIGGQWLTESCDLGYILIGHYVDLGGTGTWLQRYWDEMYVSATRARAEIIDNAIWLNRTHSEIQIPVTGNATQTTYTLNQGTLSDGEAWLVVINSDGEVSTPKSITLGSSTTPTVVLDADKQATSPTTYSGTATATAGRTITGVVSSNGFTVTADDGTFDELEEAFTVSGVTVPITDTCTATDSSAETGQDSITIDEISGSPDVDITFRGGRLSGSLFTLLLLIMLYMNMRRSANGRTNL